MISDISPVQYGLLFLISLVIVGLLTPAIRALALKLDIVDHPNSNHKTHKEPIPYLGGVSIAIGVFFTAIGSLLIGGQSSYKLNSALSVLLPALLIGFVGLLDDLRNLPPWPRFLMQNSAGSVVALFLISD